MQNFKNKLLEKQKASRSTKIATKKQIKTRQNELQQRNINKATPSKSKSVFCDDWNNDNLHRLYYQNGNGVQMKDFVDKESKENDIDTEMELISVEYDKKQGKYVQ